MRLIDADALYDDVMERYCKDCEKRKGMKRGKWRVIYEIGEAPCRACDVDDMKTELEEAPTIDAEPREIGHWLPYEFGDYHWHKCSVCGKADKYIETIGNGDLQAIRHFCPICGARMVNDD